MRTPTTLRPQWPRQFHNLGIVLLVALAVILAVIVLSFLRPAPVATPTEPETAAIPADQVLRDNPELVTAANYARVGVVRDEAQMLRDNPELLKAANYSRIPAVAEQDEAQMLRDNPELLKAANYGRVAPSVLADRDQMFRDNPELLKAANYNRMQGGE